MKQVALVLLVIFGGLLAWLFATRLSADALGVILGVVFGLLAGGLGAVLVLVAGRRRPDDDDENIDKAMYRQWRLEQSRGFPYHPPVIVITTGNGQQPAQTAPEPHMEYFIEQLRISNAYHRSD